MRVQLEAIYASPHGSGDPGDIVIVPDDHAEQMVRQGYATRVAQPEQTAVSEPEETATEEPEEEAVSIADELAHEGGGWYSHPALEKNVRGREAAIEAVEEAME